MLWADIEQARYKGRWDTDSAHHRKTFQPQTMFKSAPFLGFTDWPVKLRKNPQ